MTDLSATSDSKLRAAFAQKAVLPETQISAAEKFVNTLNEMIATGAAPSETVLKSGERLLQTLEHQTEVFMFHAAVLAGQEAATDTDLDRKLQAIDAGVEQAERTTTRLRSVLKNFA